MGHGAALLALLAWLGPLLRKKNSGCLRARARRSAGGAGSDHDAGAVTGAHRAGSDQGAAARRSRLDTHGWRRLVRIRSAGARHRRPRPDDDPGRDRRPRPTVFLLPGLRLFPGGHASVDRRIARRRHPRALPVARRRERDRVFAGASAGRLRDGDRLVGLADGARAGRLRSLLLGHAAQREPVLSDERGHRLRVDPVSPPRPPHRSDRRGDRWRNLGAHAPVDHAVPAAGRRAGGVVGVATERGDRSDGCAGRACRPVDADDLAGDDPQLPDVRRARA